MSSLIVSDLTFNVGTIFMGDDMNEKKLVDVNESNFDAEVLKQKGVVLVDFWAPWCAPCLALAPKIEEISEELSVAKLNIDENPLVTGQFGVRGIPTLILFKDGVEAARLTGNQPKNLIVDWIKKNR